MDQNRDLPLKTLGCNIWKGNWILKVFEGFWKKVSCQCTRVQEILWGGRGIRYTVKKIFRITDQFAHNYVIFVTILCPTLTKMDTLIIQNKLHILRNGFQNSQYPFPILVDFKKWGKHYGYSVIDYGYSLFFFSDPSLYKFSFYIRQLCNFPQEGSLF